MLEHRPGHVDDSPLPAATVRAIGALQEYNWVLARRIGDRELGSDKFTASGGAA